MRAYWLNDALTLQAEDGEERQALAVMMKSLQAGLGSMEDGEGVTADSDLVEVSHEVP